MGYMNREIYPKVKVIMNQSIKEAKNFDDSKVRPEHIVLSILSDDDNECTKVLKKLKVDTSELYDKLSDYVRKSDLTPRGYTSVKRSLPFSDETKTILKTLDKECEKLNDNMIDTTHIMLAILNSKQPIVEFMSNIGINYTKFKKTMLGEKLDDVKNGALDDDSDEMESFKKKPKSSDTKSKTPVLDNFCRDVSRAVEKGEIDPVVGREKEIKRVSQILSRRKKNNPVLIGEPGVGKTSIVEGLAQLIKDGNAPRTLINKKIFSLDLASIVAGTKYRGQFEERMKAILEECKANPDIVLFIDELHTIIGAGNASGSLDASNIFKPALARGELQVIGATTLDEYRENIEKDGALTRRFQQVLVEEPTLEETKIILTNIKEKYEKHHRVKYTDEAIEECVKLSARYIMDRSMPDKAIDVLDEAGATTNVGVEKPDNIKELEAKRKEINEKKHEVVKSQKYEEAAKLRDDEKKVTEDLEKAMAEWQSTLDKKVTEVGVEIISEVVSMMTGIPLTKISTQEGKRLMNLDKELMGKVIGQDDAVTKVIKAIKRNRIGIKDKNKPVGSFIFLGPTGVGKCICADTEIIIKDKRDNSIKTITIEEFKKNIVF
jgi:ATP-dependent Clp protease ATP-binding subunit ClpC